MVFSQHLLVDCFRILHKTSAHMNILVMQLFIFSIYIHIYTHTHTHSHIYSALVPPTRGKRCQGNRRLTRIRHLCLVVTCLSAMNYDLWHRAFVYCFLIINTCILLSLSDEQNRVHVNLYIYFQSSSQHGIMRHHLKVKCQWEMWTAPCEAQHWRTVSLIEHLINIINKYHFCV